MSGNGNDWAFAVKEVPVSFCIELRDKGVFGFLLPPDQILEVANEFLDGFIGLVNAAVDNNFISI